MNFYFYKYNKRQNSTKQPNSADGSLFMGVRYKEKTAFDEPIITFQSEFFDRDFNYASVGRSYFFVDKILSVTNNIWEVSLRKDILATYKTNITSSMAFIERASNGYNKYLIDEYNTVTTKVNKTVLQQNFGNGIYDTSGCFTLEVSNTLTSATDSGFNACYVLTSQQMQEIASMLYTNQNLITELEKVFGAPINSIIKCQWLPLSYDLVALQSGAVTSPVYLGSFDTGITGYVIVVNEVTSNVTFDLSNYISDNYKRNPKFMDILLCIPYIGTVSIDCRQFVEASESASSKQLFVRVCIDIRTGKQLVMVSSVETQNAPFNCFESVVAENRPISNSQNDFSGLLFSSAVGIPMIASGAGGVGALTGIGSSLLDSFRTSYSTVGTSGGSAFEGFGVACRCIILKRNTAYEPENTNVGSVMGFPVNSVGTLGAYSGYVKTINASITARNAHYHELTQLNALLNGGIYIE